MRPRGAELFAMLASHHYVSLKPKGVIFHIVSLLSPMSPTYVEKVLQTQTPLVGTLSLNLYAFLVGQAFA